MTDSNETLHLLCRLRYMQLPSQSRSNNIQLGRFKDEYNTGKYGGYKFTLDLTQPEYAIKRKYLWKSYSGVFTEVEGFSTLEETLNAFDEKLRKYGYLKEE